MDSHIGLVQGISKVLKPILKYEKRFCTNTCVFVLMGMWSAHAHQDTI